MARATVLLKRVPWPEKIQSFSASAVEPAVTPSND